MVDCGAFESCDALQLDYIEDEWNQPEAAIGRLKWSFALDFLADFPGFDWPLQKKPGAGAPRPERERFQTDSFLTGLRTRGRGSGESEDYCCTHNNTDTSGLGIGEAVGEGSIVGGNQSPGKGVRVHRQFTAEGVDDFQEARGELLSKGAFAFEVEQREVRVPGGLSG